MSATRPCAGGLALPFALGEFLLAGHPVSGLAATPETPSFEYEIPLGNVNGRIDHLAIDLPRHRLFIAELGNGSLGVVDLDKREVLRRITGLKEPQGVAYHEATNTVLVADGGDGILHRFKGTDLTPLDSIRLGEDADNVRIDAQANQVLVGYASALALIDPAAGRKTHIPSPLRSSPVEQGCLSTSPTRVRSRSWIAPWAVRRRAGSSRTRGPTSRWRSIRSVGGSWSSFASRRARRARYARGYDDRAPGDLRRRRRRLLRCQAPARLHQLRRGRHRCRPAQGDFYASIARIRTTPGARTALFVPELDRLFLAVRAGDGIGAAIWVFRPPPSS